jgi:DNA modification methylase
VGTRQNRNTVVATNGIRGNVWEINTGMFANSDATNHPAPFPESLARDHILSWSNPGDVVLDPFAGSGTTLKMAKECGRLGIGIEINAEYCDIAKARLSQGVLWGAAS